jgi:glycine/D-amino acid oxidase-like deaminating enzyme
VGPFYRGATLKLTGGLWRRFIERGGAMISGMEVTGLDQSRSHVRLELGDGGHVTAGRAVFCTGYEFLEGVKPKAFKVISTWVLATRPQPEKLWKDKSLIWEASDPYLYLRTTAGGRIIAGGEDEPFSEPAKRDEMTAKKVKAIAVKAAKLFPEADFTPDFAWSGSFGESPTGAPAIGPLKTMPRVYAVMGFGGNGITFSMLAAQLVSRHILGFKDPDAAHFAIPHRS